MSDEPKVAVITGASSGIGRATALQFAYAGYNVVLAARRKDELDTVAEYCRTQGVQAITVVTDTTDDAAMQALGEAAIDAFDHFDVWVNNAGVYLAGKFDDVPLKDMRRVVDTNFFGYVHGSYTALAHFKSQGQGTLINISSVNATAPQPFVGIYSASKAAVRTLDESIRMELRLDGLHHDIHVCTVMPAVIDTNIFKNSANYTGKELEAPDPVYDPKYVAKQIVHLAEHPKREVIIGPAGKLLALQNAHMPGSYERMISRYSRARGLGDEPVAISHGNLFKPIADNTGIYGGWRQVKVSDKQVNMVVGLGLASIATIAGVVLFWQLHKNKTRK